MQRLWPGVCGSVRGRLREERRVVAGEGDGSGIVRGEGRREKKSKGGGGCSRVRGLRKV
jgi:hypothetical protein